MTKNKLFTSIVAVSAFVSVLSGAVLVSTVNAQSDNGLIVSPAIMELNADRGGSYEFTMKLENDTAQDVYQLYPQAKKFTTKDDAGTPLLSAIEDNDSLKNWVSFSEDMYTLKPGDTSDARFKVNVPQDAEPGSYYLAVSYATDNQPKSATTSVVINQEVAALLFVTVKGAITREVSFDEFKSNLTVVDPFLDDLLLTYKIASNGNAYLKPSGNIFVGQDPEKPDQNLSLNPNQKIILPGTKRTFNQITRSAVTLPLISNKVESDSLNGDVVTNKLKQPVFKYEKFDATVVYPNSDGILEQKSMTTNVLYFPWKTLLIAIIIGLAGYGLYRWSRSYVKEHRASNERDAEETQTETVQTTPTVSKKRKTTKKSK